MTGKLLMVANWKMNKTVEESIEFLKEFKNLIKSENEIVIAPPFTALEECKKLIDKKIDLSAQNINENYEGAYTGEISAGMINELCDYVILGHSERREYFNESDDLINKKVKTALKNKLKVILCIGETLEQRESNNTNNIIKNQLNNCLKNINDLKYIVIAYEPVWAIGTGKTATPEQAEDVHRYIRQLLEKKYKDSNVRILYGGSVKASNVKELMSMKDIDGALVGGASLDPRSFADICNV